MTTEPADDRRAVWSAEQVRALGVTTDLVTAAAILGIGRTTAHALARADRFPVPVLRVGRRYRVPVAPILRLLALDTAPASDDPTTRSPGPGGAATDLKAVRLDGGSAHQPGLDHRTAAGLTQRT